MQTLSADLGRALRSGGRRKTVIDVTEPFGSAKLFEDIPIVDGSITVDRNAECRRSGSLSFEDPDLRDVFYNSQNSAFGLEIIVRYGVVYPNLSEEYIQVGVFNVGDFSWEEGSEELPTVQLFDRSRVIQRAPLLNAVDYSGKFAQTVIQQILTSVDPRITVVFEDGLPNARLPGGSVFDDSRWEVIQKCAEVMAAEAYFDPQGILQVVAVKDPTATEESTVWEFNVGEGFTDIDDSSGTPILTDYPEGVLIKATRNVSREQTFNAVIVYGSAPNGSTTQPFAIAYDNDPSSPTYYNGPFGKSIRRVDNQLLLTQEQCAETAVAELKNNLGLARSIDFSSLGNPALEAGDHVLFTFTDGFQEVHLLDSFSIPLAQGEFSGSTRTNPSRQTNSIRISRGTFNPDRPPSKVTQPNVTSIGDHTVTISWTAANAGSHPIDRYEVLNTDNEVLKTTSATVFSTAVNGLVSGTSYALRVRAVDTEGNEGPLSTARAFKTTGIPGVPADQKVYTRRYAAVWSASYDGDGDRMTWKGTQMYQGWTEDGGLGNRRSLCGFDYGQIRRDLQDATVISCRAKFYFKHWWFYSGGTAVIGVHKWTSRPGGWDWRQVDTNRVRSSAWPRGKSREVNLGTTIGNGFKNGTWNGLTLGPGPSKSHTYYGYALGAGSGSLTPELIITYRK